MHRIRDSLFGSPFEQLFLRGYRRVFSIAEIEEQPILQWVFGATLLSYFATFSLWIYRHELTLDSFREGEHRCWPYFQSCGEWLFLRALPDGYSQMFLYMVFFGLMALSVYLLHKKEFELAHISVVPIFVWHMLGCFVLSGSLAGNFDYYLFLLAFALLFLPHKEFFLKLFLVLFYFLAAISKIHESWILGTYFSSLKTGLPLFPDWSIPLWTNLVIFMEMVGGWFLLSRRRPVQRIVLIFFVIFHLYSGIIVGYRYPVTVLPTLIILFGPFYRFTPIPHTRRSLSGWAVVVLLFAAQLSSLLIPGDEKLTLEANKFGLYMFEANHQCVSNTTIVYKDGSQAKDRRESISARARCDPYYYWFRLNVICERDPTVQRIEWTFDHSINGEPFLRIVDEKNACSLHYTPFRHNTWIKTTKDGPPAIGRPVENVYH